MQKWKTGIATHKNANLYVRGKRLVDLIGAMSFTEAAFFVLKGKKPTKEQTAMLDAVLVSAINHGLEAPSAFIPRIVASTGNSVTTALASGVLSIGDHHGGAVEEAMRVFYSNKSAKEIVAEMTVKQARMPGFGHKIYKDADPRVSAMFKHLESLNIKSKFMDIANDIQAELKKQAGKNLPLNIDGAMAAVLCELRLDPIQGKAFFALARFPSMMANIEEELKNEKPYRRLDESDIEYIGPEIK